MIPPAFATLEPQLWLWLVAMLRPGAAFVAAPLFGANFVPVQMRLIIALAVGIPGLAAADFALPAGGVVTFAGFALIAGELLVGLAIGFAAQLGFAAAQVAGEVIGNAMGLGFAGMVDPASGHQNPAVSQYLSILATFLFLATDGHLALAAAVVESYRALPPGAGLPSHAAIGGLVGFGGSLFSAGFVIALPVTLAVILIQLVMAMLARSAPQLNLFAVGLPVALIVGIVLLAATTPLLANGIMVAIDAGLGQARAVTGI